MTDFEKSNLLFFQSMAAFHYRRADESRTLGHLNMSTYSQGQARHYASIAGELLTALIHKI